MRQYFYGMGYWGRSIFLLVATIVSAIFAVLLTQIFSVLIFGVQAVAHEEPGALKFTNVLSTMGMFVVPVVLLCRFCVDKPLAQSLCISKAPRWQSVLLSLAIMLAVQPLVSWVGDINLHMQLPESLKSIEDFMRESEDRLGDLTKKMLACDSFGGMLVNVLVFAVTPAFVEEIYFRVGIQHTILTEAGRIRPWLAVLWASLIFSAIHMQFFGFMPRAVLGFVLGMVFVMTGSIWASMIAHALNNSIVVVYSYAVGGGDMVNEPDMLNPWMVAASAVATVALFIALQRFEKKHQKKFDN